MPNAYKTDTPFGPMTHNNPFLNVDAAKLRSFAVAPDEVGVERMCSWMPAPGLVGTEGLPACPPLLCVSTDRICPPSPSMTTSFSSLRVVQADECTTSFGQPQALFNTQCVAIAGVAKE